jgi:hypothetical protein
MFNYDMIPVGDDYVFQIEISFVDVVDDFYIEFDSYPPVPEYVQKDKALTAVIPMHTLEAGNQNGFTGDALSCGLLSGTLYSTVAPASISSALYLETFNGPSQCFIADGPVPVTPPHSHHQGNYLPPVLAALISFFATIGAFLVLVFCCCLCCRCLCGKRLRCCRKSAGRCGSSSSSSSYPACQTQESEMQEAAAQDTQGLLAAQTQEFQLVPETQQAAVPYLVPVFPTNGDGQIQYVMLYPAAPAAAGL